MVHSNRTPASYFWRKTGKIRIDDMATYRFMSCQFVKCIKNVIQNVHRIIGTGWRNVLNTIKKRGEFT